MPTTALQHVPKMWAYCYCVRYVIRYTCSLLIIYSNVNRNGPEGFFLDLSNNLKIIFDLIQIITNFLP